MKNIKDIGQLLLRLAIAAGFLIPVMDRFGLLGPPGSGASWGDWKHFVDYTNTLIPFANRPIANVAGGFSTLGEFVFGIMLIVGFRIKEASLGTAALTLGLGLCMGIFLKISAPFDYPVFVFTGAGMVLAGLDHYEWSIDNYLKKRSL